jgi:two-component system, chemotaxis family, chemotaxis protein CheY
VEEKAMTAKRVLSVGQCGADHASISSTLRRQFSAEVAPADGGDEALGLLRQGGFDLVLVNRTLDAGGSGLRFIEQLKADETLKAIPVMLVSNYEDAQRQAEAAGALPGFGKAALGQPRTLDRLRAVLGQGGAA